MKPRIDKANNIIWGIIITIGLLELFDLRTYIKTIEALISFSNTEWNGLLILNAVYLVWLPLALILFGLKKKAGWYLLSFYLVAACFHGLYFFILLLNNFTDIITN